MSSLYIVAVHFNPETKHKVYIVESGPYHSKEETKKIIETMPAVNASYESMTVEELRGLDTQWMSG